MDNRSTVRYRSVEAAREPKERPAAGWSGGGKWGQPHDAVPQGKKWPAAEVKKRRAGGEALRPYPKPTLVDESSRRRRTGEPSLRNSAKWSRNFGRRDAS